MPCLQLQVLRPVCAAADGPEPIEHRGRLARPALAVRGATRPVLERTSARDRVRHELGPPEQYSQASWLLWRPSWRGSFLSLGVRGRLTRHRCGCRSDGRIRVSVGMVATCAAPDCRLVACWRFGLGQRPNRPVDLSSGDSACRGTQYGIA